METLTMKEEVISMMESLERLDPHGFEWFMDKLDYTESYCKECMAYRLVKGWSVRENVRAVDREGADEPMACSLCQAGMEDCPDDRWEE